MKRPKYGPLRNFCLSPLLAFKISSIKISKKVEKEIAATATVIWQSDWICDLDTSIISFRQNLQPDLAVGVIGEDRDWRVSSLAKEQLPVFKLDDALATSRGRGGLRMCVRGALGALAANIAPSV